MIVHKHYFRDRQSGDAPIRVIPSAPRYSEEIEALHRIAYDYVGYISSSDKDECMTAAKFRNHHRVFPEGQFIALDTDTDQVVGATVSMLTNYNPARPVHEPWAKLTDFG
jgi:hypothetical protein